MSSKYKVLCGVPQEECSGTKLSTDQQFHTHKAHETHQEAFKCMARFLTNHGYERVGSREFKEPDTGMIRILPRQSSFGAHLRAGKLQERFMPGQEAGNRGVLFRK